MNRILRFSALILVTLALLSGRFPGSEFLCRCGSGVANAQVQEAASEPAAPVGQLPIATSSSNASAPGDVLGALPKMVDLGADKCQSCKKMKPILEEAKRLYEGRAEIVFIDVWKDRDASSQYGIRTIPTQIFFDSTGKETFRHEGLFSMEEIRSQFEKMSVFLTEK